jgi:protein SCO1
MTMIKTTSSIAVALSFFSLLLAAPFARSQAVPNNVGAASSSLPPILKNVGFRPQLNSQMPLDLPFRDETGKEVHLGDYFHHQKPVVLAFIYYSCPMLCPQLQQGVVGALRMISFNPGRDYEVVFLSFDDRDTPEIAAEKRATALKQFHRPETASGWHFLTGSKESILAATQAANFTFNFDPKSNLFAHASGILLLTPEGRISRYFYGIEFPARDLRLGLVDASEGKIGSPIDQILCYCFQYDPSTARYSLTILRVMRLGGIVTVLGLVFGILIFRRRDSAGRSKKSRRQEDDRQGAR